jgi:DNA-binding NarL/FixJ family response regulator
MTIQVALVDDHNVVREGIAQLVDSEPDLAVNAQAASVAGGRALLTTGCADVLVLDVTLPDGSGLDLARSARAAYPTMGIVVLTMHDDDDTLLEALDAGASALVRKSSPADAVLGAIRHSAVAPGAFTATGLGGALRRHADAAALKPALTPRESEVLLRIVDGDSIAAVARHLYMSESTVKTHVSRVYEKLGAHNRASAAIAAVRVGLVNLGEVRSGAKTSC